MDVLRIDSGTVRGVQRTPQGGLRVDAAVTRVGVLKYRDANGREWSELRPPEEVFSPDSLQTLRDAPVTIGHPPGLVTPANWRDLSRGHVADAPRRDGEFVAAPVVVQDGEAVARIEAGQLHDVSAGYVMKIDPTPGEWNGERYDGVQRNIRYNHVAVLPEGHGRAGTDVALRMDGAAVQVTAPHAQKTESAMKIKVRGREFEVRNDADMAPAQAAVDEMQTKMDADATQLDSVQKALSDAMVQVAQLKASLVAAQSASAAEETAEGDVPEEVLDAVSTVRAKLPERIAKVFGSALSNRMLRADAKSVLGDAFDVAGKKPEEIQRAVLAKLAPGVRFDALDVKTLGTVYATTMAAYSSVKPQRRADSHSELLRFVNEGAPAGQKTLEQIRQDAFAAEVERGRKPFAEK